jgi:hypothetical protein
LFIWGDTNESLSKQEDREYSREARRESKRRTDLEERDNGIERCRFGSCCSDTRLTPITRNNSNNNTEKKEDWKRERRKTPNKQKRRHKTQTF